MRLGRLVTEVGVLGYLLCIPLGQSIGTAGRNLALLTIVLGMVLARLPGGLDRPPSFQFVVPFAFFAVSTFCSLVFSTYRELSLARVAYAPIAFLLFFAVQDAVTDGGAFRRVFIALSVVCAALGLDGAYQYVTGHSLVSGTELYKGRVTGSLPHPNDVALISILLPMIVSALLHDRSRLVRGVVVAGLPAAIFTVLVSLSRNAWLGLAVGLGVLVVFSVKRRIVVAITAGAGIVFAIAFAFDIGGAGRRAASLLGGPWRERLGVWLVAWEMFKESPLVGKGAHTFGEFYHPYLGRFDLPSGSGSGLMPVPWAHNLPLEMLAERGALGLAGFLLPVLASGVRLARACRAPGARPLAVGLAASLTAFLVMGLFDLTFLKDWPQLVYWLLAALVARLPMVSGAASRRSPG